MNANKFTVLPGFLHTARARTDMAWPTGATAVVNQVVGLERRCDLYRDNGQYVGECWLMADRLAAID